MVRIADSPYAPIFEVVERPNGWDRKLTETRREATGERDPLSDTRLAFWERYCQRSPEAAALGVKPMRAWNAYFPMAGKAALLSVFVAQKYVGAYVRAPWRSDEEDLHARLEPHADRLSALVGSELTDGRGHFLRKRAEYLYSDPSQWDAIIDWMEDVRRTYTAALEQVLGEEA